MARRLPLPSNATPLELALSAALALPDDLLLHPDVLEQRLVSPADEDLPFLVWEWGLQPVERYLDSPRRALSEGRRWQKIRGTIPAGHMARGWIGVTAVHEAEQDKRYHLHLDRLPDAGLLEAIIELSRLSSSVRARLYRLTYGLDLRAARAASGSRAGACILAADSGLRLSPDGPVLSFLAFAGAATQLAPTVLAAYDPRVGSSALRQLPIRLGLDRVGLAQRRAAPDQAMPSLGLSLASGLRARQADDAIAPIAAVRGGHSRLAAWQSTFVGLGRSKGGGLLIGFSLGSNVPPPAVSRLYALPEPLPLGLRRAGDARMTAALSRSSSAVASQLRRLGMPIGRRRYQGEHIARGDHIQAHAAKLVSTALSPRLRASVRSAHTRLASPEAMFAALDPVAGTHPRLSDMRAAALRQLPGWRQLEQLRPDAFAGLSGQAGLRLSGHHSAAFEAQMRLALTTRGGFTVGQGGHGALSQNAPFSGLPWSPIETFTPRNPAGLFEVRAAEEEFQ